MNAHSTIRSRTKLLHIFSTFSVGGPQVRFARIANATTDAFSHAVIAMDGRDEAQDLIQGAKVEILTNPAASNLLSRLTRYGDTILRSRSDVLVTYNWGAIEWALANLLLGRKGLPHIHFEDGFGPEEADRQIARRVWLRRLALRKATSIVVASRNLERIATSVWGLPQQKIRHIANGVEIEPQSIRQSGDRKAAGLSETACVVGWIGGLRAEKNVPRLVDALAQVPSNVHLAVVGSGSERPRVENGVRERGLVGRVTLLGYRKQAASLLPLFDIFALSSDTEQMPLVILEAMEAALPVVATDVGDVRSMLSPANAPFVVPRSAESLAQAISVLAADPALRRAVGDANRTHLREHFSFNAMLDQYVALFEGAGAAASNHVAARVQ